MIRAAASTPPFDGYSIMKLILLLSAILFSAVPTVAQTHFYLDEPFKRPAKIPEGLVPLLLNEIKSVCPGDAAFQSTNPRSLFTASKITLTNPRPGFILKSGHHCLTGGDNDWFWVFLRTARRYRLVLTGGTNSIDVVTTKTRGLRDIETNGATARTNYKDLYKFSGTVYKLSRCWQSTPVEAKPHRVPCH